MELAERNDWRSHATRIVYREYLTRWIKPCWGSINIRDVRTVAVEKWLRQLQRQDGEPLANSTKAKIRNLMSVLFNHAIRYEWLEQSKNPIKLVLQSAMRQLTPEVLEADEVQGLLSQLESPFQVMVLLDVAKAGSFISRCGSKSMVVERAHRLFETGRLDICWFMGQGEEAFLAQHSAEENHSASGGARWHQEKNRLAYTPAHLFNDAYCQWRECEGGSGTNETRKQPLHFGCLYASKNSRRNETPNNELYK